MNMKKLIEKTKNEKDMLSKISFSIGYLKSECEKNGNEKQFSANEVLELLENIRKD